MVIQKPIKILFLTKYGFSGPSSRYRFYQYFEILNEHGIFYNVKPFFSDRYVRTLYSTGGKKYFEAFRSFFKRLLILPSVFAYDLIVIEYEILPYFPAIIERFLCKTGRKYIVDYDDAIFMNYEKSKNWLVRSFLYHKIAKVIKYANCVITGNKFLYEYASGFNKNIHLIPTVVSRTRYDSVPSRINRDKFIIGWIGSHTGSKYLLPLCNVFRNLKRQDVHLNLIGFDESLRYHFEGIDINWIDWKQDSEIEEIKKFNVGIMPLDLEPWSLGKCGFKIIQYMACGLPVIASSIGSNIDLIENGINGFLVKTDDEWIRSITCLADHPEMAQKMGKKGYEKFIGSYSFEVNVDKYINILKTASI